MSLKETLNNDFKEAMKAKDKIRKDTINFVRAAIKQTEVDTREEVDDQGIAAILAKQVKMRKDALADFEAAGRQDMLDQYKAEIDVLMEYMPQQLTDEEIANIVKETAGQLGIEAGSGKASMGKRGNHEHRQGDSWTAGHRGRQRQGVHGQADGSDHG